MAKVTVRFDELIVEREGLDDCWALRSQLEIPLAHVRSAMDGSDLAGEHLARHGHDLRGMDVLRTGLFIQDGDRVFWGVSDPAKAVAIALMGMQWEWLVVQVDDPAGVIARIDRTLGGAHRDPAQRRYRLPR